MICRLRLRSGTYLSAILLLVGVSLAAHSTGVINVPVTQSQMESFVYGRIAAAGAVVFTAFWILLNAISSRSERALTASIDRLEAVVRDFSVAQAQHDADPLAHTAASEHNHDPMNEQMDHIEAKLDRLLREHEIINAGCAFGSQRSPKDSTKPRRSDDPPMFDGRNLRGKK